MRVAILYNEHCEDPDPQAQHRPWKAVADAIAQLGHELGLVPCTLDLATARSRLETLQPDVVFNHVESLGGSDQLMPAATLLLEMLQLPYTGCPTHALLATSSKLTAKQSLRRAGLPTPAWFATSRSGQPSWQTVTPTDSVRRHACSGLSGESPHFGDALSAGQPLPGRSRFPEPDFPEPDFPGRNFPEPGPARVILKSVFEHASFRMDDQAVVTWQDRGLLDELLRQRQAQWRRPCFAEVFIDGREFNLSLLAEHDSDSPPGSGQHQGASGRPPAVLPPAEIDFSAYPHDKPRIVGHRAKWDSQSFEFHHTPRRFDFPTLDQPLLERMSRLACRCWRLFDLRGYARVDFRVDAEGQPWILEVNANPCLVPDAGFAAALHRAGIPYHRAIQRILDEALSR